MGNLLDAKFPVCRIVPLFVTLLLFPVAAQKTQIKEFSPIPPACRSKEKADPKASSALDFLLSPDAPAWCSHVTYQDRITVFWSGAEGAGLKVLEEYGLKTTSPDINRTDGTEGATVLVDPGTTGYWIQILEKHEAILSAEKRVIRLASADKTIGLGIELITPPPGVSLTTNLLSDVRMLVRSFIVGHFYGRGRVVVEADKRAFLKFRILGLRGEVLPELGRWENLILHVFFDLGEQEMQVHLIMSGTLASGAGSTPPPQNRFGVRISQNHHVELQTYLNALGVRVADHLREVK